VLCTSKQNANYYFHQLLSLPESGIRHNYAFPERNNEILCHVISCLLWAFKYTELACIYHVCLLKVSIQNAYNKIILKWSFILEATDFRFTGNVLFVECLSTFTMLY